MKTRPACATTDGSSSSRTWSMVLLVVAVVSVASALSITVGLGFCVFYSILSTHQSTPPPPPSLDGSDQPSSATAIVSKEQLIRQRGIELVVSTLAVDAFTFIVLLIFHRVGLCRAAWQLKHMLAAYDRYFSSDDDDDKETPLLKQEGGDNDFLWVSSDSESAAAADDDESEGESIGRSSGRIGRPSTSSLRRSLSTNDMDEVVIRCKNDDVEIQVFVVK